MAGLAKGYRKVEVKLSWDPAPVGAPNHDLDLIAATYTAAAPSGPPTYLVHFDSRSPDGTIILNRDSHDGRGFGADEVLTLDLYRVPETLTRVVIGVAIQQHAGRLAFGEVARPVVSLHEGYTVLARHELTTLPESTAATVAEFVRESGGRWLFTSEARGYDADPVEFGRVMGEG
ncbi:TerD family protein [Streptomyces sp. NPDC051940]|uniref:TerD family protein n=1 Tax=Streptomyces sp. NPDC051940 TaxID=3155675 RepID=UPI00343F08D9